MRRAEMRRTGGGPASKPDIDVTVEMALTSVPKDSIDGVQGGVDTCDLPGSFTGATDVLEETLPEEAVVECSSGETESHNAAEPSASLDLSVTQFQQSNCSKTCYLFNRQSTWTSAQQL
ncbi:uncharacterized protein LOC135466188 [Liolophura sinensis]|uniref:uncharacterized protein LOC135466188 n=1 Tax=Liolophura sinensis TaxID=3198878 RepID=UPI0031588A8C